jgi:hypothetical protein
VGVFPKRGATFADNLCLIIGRESDVIVLLSGGALFFRINSAYRRYLRKIREVKGKQQFEIDAGKLAEEARFDGIFVLRNQCHITPLQAVLR